MRIVVSRLLKLFLSFSTLLLLSAAVQGQPTGKLQPIARADPQQMLEQATNQLLDIARVARSYAEDDPERYYAEVSVVLDQVMDIQYFARGVMATYASARRYKALQTDAQRAAFRDRLARFETALKRVWMVKYSDALLSFEGEGFEMKKLASGDDSEDKMSIEQIVHDQGGETYVFQYNVHKLKDGSWKVINVVVEGVNLGLTYRSQFAEAVENHKGDIDYVVDHWVDIMIRDKSGAPTNNGAEPA